MTIYFTVAIIFIIFVIILLCWLGRRKRAIPTTAPEAKANPFHRCPLCDAALARGQRIHSRAYSFKDRKLMYIFGCPECYHSPRPRLRTCPVCRRTLGGENFLIGKMWQTEAKIRLHVSGCNLCRPV